MMMFVLNCNLVIVPLHKTGKITKTVSSYILQKLKTIVEELKLHAKQIVRISYLHCR